MQSIHTMNNNSFTQLSNSLNHIRALGDGEERQHVTNVLKSLNECDSRHFHSSNSTRIVLLINQLCLLIPPDENSLVQETVKLLHKLLTHLNQFPESTIHSMPTTLHWLQNAIKATNNLITPLNALFALLQCQPEMAQSSFHAIAILDQLTSLLLNNDTSAIQIATLQCISLLTTNKNVLNTPEIIPKVDNLFKHILRHLSTNQHTSNDAETCQMTSQRLRILHYILPSLDGSTVHTATPLLIGACRSLMLYQLPHIPRMRIAPVIPTAFGDALSAYGIDAHAQPTKPNAQHPRKKRPIGRKDVKEHQESSSSATMTASDIDSTDKARVYREEALVRLEALTLLHTLTTHMNRATLCSYLSALLADAPSTRAHYVSTSMLQDPSPRCRTVAMSVLQHVLLTAKQCFLHAEELAVKTAAFTPLSAIFAAMLRELHRAICFTLSEATSGTLTTQTLKCLAVLVQVTPYHRLRAGLTSKVIRNVKVHLVDESTVQVAAFIVIGCVLNSTPVVKETMLAVLTATAEDDVQVLPWLLKTCFARLYNDDVVAPVQLESVEVMAAMCGHFEQLVYPHLGEFCRALRVAMEGGRNADVRFHAARACERLGEALGRHHGLKGCLEVGVEHWRGLLDGDLVKLTQSSMATLRSIACDCLASIGDVFFDLLPHAQRIVLVTSLLTMTADAENTVRGSAVRAIGVLLLFDAAKADFGFFMDAAGVIMRCLEDESLCVRIKASWSLANLCDRANGDEQDGGVLIGRLVETAVRAAGNDSEKVKANAVRALGSVLVHADEDGLRAGVEALLGCAMGGCMMKVRWNACYALGHVMSAMHAPSMDAMRKRVLVSLAQLIGECRNFKVRINATVAVGGCALRAQYGDVLGVIWTAMVRGLESAQNVAGCSELQHRDHLVEQICLGLAHLVSVMEAEDLVGVEGIVSAHRQLLQMHLRRVFERLPPEMTSRLFAARENLMGMSGGQLSVGERQAKHILEEIFVFDSIV